MGRARLLVHPATRQDDCPGGDVRRRCTIVVIAHRLSTVARADHILVLADGRLIEQGAHEELLALDGQYAGFWRLQSRVCDSPLSWQGGRSASLQARPM